MLTVKPFKAYRPNPPLAKSFVVPPYDVLTTKDIAKIKEEKPNSFINVIHSEVNCPNLNPHAPEVYQEAKRALEEFIQEGVLIQEEEATFYIYEEETKKNCQRGIVYIEDAGDYEDEKILKHELTLKVKEQDRKDHFRGTQMQTEPVFFFAPQLELENWTTEKLYDFEGDDGTIHRLWKVLGEDVEKVQKTLESLGQVYIADGHHRTASATEMAREFGSGIMAVVFPGKELHIEPYHRMIKSFKEKNLLRILQELEENFIINKVNWNGEQTSGKEYFLLTKQGDFKLTLREEKIRNNVIDDLGASIVQDYILEPVFNIVNPREDDNLDFCGGVLTKEKTDEILEEIEGLILMPATTMEEIVKVADQKLIMPPKSTWFEPKLISGLFLYSYK